MVPPRPTGCRAPAARYAFGPRRRAPSARVGAQEKTRTSTSFRPLEPESSASTNSATWAWAAHILHAPGLVNRFPAPWAGLRRPARRDRAPTNPATRYSTPNRDARSRRGDGVALAVVAGVRGARLIRPAVGNRPAPTR